MKLVQSSITIQFSDLRPVGTARVRKMRVIERNKEQFAIWGSFYIFATGPAAQDLAGWDCTINQLFRSGSISGFRKMFCFESGLFQ